MRVRVTVANSIFGTGGALAVGDEVEINGDVPAGWVGRVEVIHEAPARGKKEAVTNPAKDDGDKAPI